MTKDAEKAFVIIYSEYLRRRKAGTAKNQALQFEGGEVYDLPGFDRWIHSDIDDSVRELKQAGYLKKFILGDIELTSSGIAYMESKPKEYFSAFVSVVKDLLSLVAAFMP